VGKIEKIEKVFLRFIFSHLGQLAAKLAYLKDGEPILSPPPAGKPPFPSEPD
jgi:hypothetical protein